MANGRIENRDEYERACRWWEEKRKELDDPLLTDEQREKLRRRIDFVKVEIERYIVGVEASKDPNSRRFAIDQGVTFYEVDAAGNVVGIVEPGKPEPREESNQEKSVAALAGWLDDD